MNKSKNETHSLKIRIFAIIIELSDHIPVPSLIYHRQRNVVECDCERGGKYKRKFIIPT